MNATDLQERLIDHLVTHVLTPPESLVKPMMDLKSLVSSLSTDDLEMEDREAGGDNHRAVRSLEKDLDQVKSSVDNLIADQENVLLIAFEKALNVISDVDIEWDRWDAHAWLVALQQQGPSDYEVAMRTIVGSARQEDVAHWYALINDQAPKDLSQGSRWLYAMQPYKSQAANLPEFLDAYLNDDQTVAPEMGKARERTTPWSLPLREQKMKFMQRQTFQDYASQNASSLKDHVWSTVGPDLEFLDWSLVIQKMVDGMSRDNTLRQNGRFAQPLPIEQVSKITPWVSSLINTGALDGWLQNSEHWRPVVPPSPHVDPLSWLKDHVKNGTFTWTVMTTAFEAMNQAPVATALVQMGERWSLAHTVDTLDVVAAPSRARSRL